MQVKRSTVSKNLKKLEKFYALRQKVVETNDLWVNKTNSLSNNLDNPKLKLTLTNNLRYLDENEFRNNVIGLVNFYVLESKNKSNISYVTKYTNMWRSYDSTVDVIQTILHNIGIRNTGLTDNSFNDVNDDNPVYSEKELSAKKKEILLTNIFNELEKMQIIKNKTLENIKVGDILFYSKQKNSAKPTNNVSFVESITKNSITVVEQGRGCRLSKITYKILEDENNILVNNKTQIVLDGCTSIYGLRKQIAKHSMLYV